MKDGTKTISERATRFLPVDMKDRLKSAFNRNAANPAPRSESPDDSPDYTAIFNANRAAAAAKNTRSAPPAGAQVERVTLEESSDSATLRNSARRLAQDIEDAEIVTGPSDERAASVEWTSSDALDPGVMVKLNKSGSSDSKLARRNLDASERTGSPANAEEPRPVLEQDAKPASQQNQPAALKDTNPASKSESAPQAKIEAKYDNSKNGDPVSHKSKSRFFGDFSSAESVRLKVEKRNEKRPEVVPTAPNGTEHVQPESRPAQVSVLGAERGAAPVFELEAEPLEQPINGYQTTTEGVAFRPATSEQANINHQQEYDSMDANEHESENGAAVQTEGSPSGASIVIERSSKFSGQLKFSGAITIDGQVEGELVADRIVIHEGGVVNATVDGDTVVVAGTVKGDIHAHSELEILSSGAVDGSVTAPAITVRRGARVEGRCTIGVPRE